MATKSLFTNRLALVLRSLELGFPIKTPGHTIEWDKELEAPAFLMLRKDHLDQVEDEWLMKIDSDEAWRGVLKYARALTEEELTILAANVALTRIKEEG